ncbi:hypothetical protein BC833DRAFT_659121 [Globomyces pollinis-pini]|nr:hypothetical protein BC833DRAFT_659121 [Globomyces pollinis-pini]KAJ2994166.1 hypothetical protein HDV02_001782 [Globomyces sp. JEL0801]
MGKKDSYNNRQGLQFQADTPDFLKQLKSQRTESTLSDKIATNRVDEDDDKQDLLDESPQVVLGAGVTSKDAKDLLGVDVVDTREKFKTKESDKIESKQKIAQPQSKKARVTKKSLETNKKLSVKESKKLKNSTFLSFDDE